MKKSLFAFTLLIAISLGSLYPKVEAAKTVTFKTVINPGTLLTDIRDQFGQTIANPTLFMGKVTNSYDCRTEQNGLNASLGNQFQRIYVDNPMAAFDGWSLTIAAEDGPEALWAGSDSASFDYNDNGGEGCFDSDADGEAGELSIDPSHSSIRSDCQVCSTSHIFVGSSGPRSFSNYQAITLLRATGDSDDLGSWYMTDVDVYQSIPPEQVGDSYELEMVLTATAT